MTTVDEARTEILDWVKPSGRDELAPMLDTLIRAVRAEEREVMPLADFVRRIIFSEKDAQFIADALNGIEALGEAARTDDRRVMICNCIDSELHIHTRDLGR